MNETSSTTLFLLQEKKEKEKEKERKETEIESQTWLLFQCKKKNTKKFED